MSELNAFKRAVQECIETLEQRGANPRTVLADSRGLWFEEDSIALSEFWMNLQVRQIGFVDTSMDPERVIVVGEEEEMGHIDTSGAHLENYREQKA